MWTNDFFPIISSVRLSIADALIESTLLAMVITCGMDPDEEIDKGKQTETYKNNTLGKTGSSKNGGVEAPSEDDDDGPVSKN